MLNRILVYIENETEVESLLDYAEMLKNKYGVAISGIHVRDTRKTEISLITEKWAEFEKNQLDIIKAKFRDRFEKEKFIIETGEVDAVIFERLKGYDLLITGKGEKLSSNIRLVLMNHYKPVIVVPDNLEKFQFRRVVVANDMNHRANKSFFNFMNIFSDISTYDFISVNKDKEDANLKSYLEITEKKGNFLNLNGDVLEIFVEKSKKYDLVVMGDLAYSYILEKLTNNVGLKLLENLNLPIFIG